MAAIEAGIAFFGAIFEFEFVGRREYITGLLGTFFFAFELFQNAPMDAVARCRIDRMSDIDIQASPSAVVLGKSVAPDGRATLIAKAGPQVVLLTATLAAIRDPPRGHRNEDTARTFNDLEVTDDELVVQGDGAISSQLVATILVLRQQLYPDFGDLHRDPP